MLKPGFLALLEDPFDTKLLDIIVFDVLPPSDGNGEGRVSLAEEIKDRNPLRYAFKVRFLWLMYVCVHSYLYSSMPLSFAIVFWTEVAGTLSLSCLVSLSISCIYFLASGVRILFY